jgi:hypothetical protein
MQTQQVETPMEQTPGRRFVPTIYIVAGVVLGLVVVGLFIWAVIWLAQTQAPTIETVRDILIIALALESCVFGIVLMLLLIMVIRLVNMLEFEIKPILEKTNETVGMVRGTTTFVSRNVVKPVTIAGGYLAGVRRGLQTLFGDAKRNLSE